MPGIRRPIHISAPHPSFDLGTPYQAAALFKSTMAKSLLIAGRHRYASNMVSGCVRSPNPEKPYYVTDPTHNKACYSTVYFSETIDKLSRTNPSMMPLALFSSGKEGDNESKSWYTDDVDRPIKRLKSNLRRAFPEWNVSLPTDSQCHLIATKNVVARFLNGIPDEQVCTKNSDPHNTKDVDGNCLSITVPTPLNNIYAITQFKEQSGASYCVLAEIREENTRYAKGWGLFAVPATRAAVSRHIHLSAPHPLYDDNTPAQAAALFKSTKAKSLLIAGRSRLAFKEPTDCVAASEGDIYYTTDPGHNKLEPFYDANRSIYSWQTAQGGCPAPSCAFIQFHGKGPSTCPADHIFLSTGLSNNAWYGDSVTRPVKRLKAQLQLTFPTWNISLPIDSACTLTATKNVVGRFLNGIQDDSVCTTASMASLVQGTFVHIEQAAISRLSTAYDAWGRALGNAFEVIG
ncbi:hypothetical protein H0H81_009999 [Sphagnurus paluster]|uniref:Uncharacterized protein n=1 Tax=Sphagnurus paluster TaxID=117069 RepID=A0A9P7GJV2_9AGAR|nr:hypothetical protein H0H81_009999 [Sphagnurus paluster]